MNYKIGDSVRIKTVEEMLENPLVKEVDYGDLSGPDDAFVRSMRIFCEKTAIISDIVDGEGGPYRIEDDGDYEFGHYSWCDWMLSPIDKNVAKLMDINLGAKWKILSEEENE